MPRNSKSVYQDKDKLKNISLTVSKDIFNWISSLVKNGTFASKSEVIRYFLITGKLVFENKISINSINDFPNNIKELLERFPDVNIIGKLRYK